MAKVLVFCDVYLPGYKAGGPVPSISRIIETDESNEFRVVTRDRDVGDLDPYPAARPRTWQEVGAASVAYMRPGMRDVSWMSKEVRIWRPDFYYVNSLQSPWFSILPFAEMRLGHLPEAKVVLAPRGEASAGARALKQRKKRYALPFIKKLVGRSVTWHLSSPLEEADIRRWWGRDLPDGHEFIIRADLAVTPAQMVSAGEPPAGRSSIVTFASRIDRMKGLAEAISLMAGVSVPFDFRVSGAVEESDYWAECLRIADVQLQPESFRYEGEFTPKDAQRIFAESALLVLPTKGENFGHVIAEALSVGCPVLIPDTTPWTAVVQAGGGAIFGDERSARQFVREVLTESATARVARRTRVLAAYRDWFGQHQDLRSIFSISA